MRTSQSVFLLPVPTVAGVFLAGYSQAGLCELSLPGSKVPKVPTRSSQVPDNVRRWHLLTCRAVERALKGRALGELPPLDLSSGTKFQRQVWTAMQSIPLGQTSSYRAIAVSIGNPKACRAVGGACGANPVPVLIPCHRVLAANQRLGGFSGGLDWKIKLLAGEGSWTPVADRPSAETP
jgi:O-6-methylguanine DNA methyltransferase